MRFFRPALTPIIALGMLSLACHRGDRMPTLASVADSLTRGVADPGCAAIAPTVQDSLMSGGIRPVTACRWTAGDTTTVVLRAADSSVVSIVRMWRTLNLQGDYLGAAAQLERSWGPGESCPANDQGEVRGDRFYPGQGAYVRLYARVPAALVIDYERGVGSCRPQ